METSTKTRKKKRPHEVSGAVLPDGSVVLASGLAKDVLTRDEATSLFKLLGVLLYGSQNAPKIELRPDSTNHKRKSPLKNLRCQHCSGEYPVHEADCRHTGLGNWVMR